MRRVARLGSIVVLLVAALAILNPTRAAGAPVITRAESRVTVLSDGSLDIKYRLSFHETDVRSGITTMGPFDPGHEILDSHIESAQGERRVVLNSKGEGFYSVDFGFDTVSGEEYTVQVHYRVPYALDETSVDGESHRVLEWAAIEWSLQIGEQIVNLVLPIELPVDVTKPEQVTDELVDASGLRVDQSNVTSFDRWVYYPTPDEASGKNWLSIYVSKENVPPQYHFRTLVYLPSSYFSGPVALPTDAATEPDLVAPVEPESAPVDIWAMAKSLSCFCVGAGVLAFVILAVVLKRAAPKPAPKEYKAPEIEVETFEKPGLVPEPRRDRSGDVHWGCDQGDYPGYSILGATWWFERS